MQSWACSLAPCPGPSQMLRSHRDPSPGLSLLYSGPPSPALDQLEPSRISGGEELLLGLWSTQIFWVKLTPISAHSHFTEGQTEAVASQAYLSYTSSLPAWPRPPPVGAGGPPCSLQGMKSSTRQGWPSGWGGGRDACASPAATSPSS